MTINIELFCFPAKDDMLPLLNESPLSNYQLEPESFSKEDISLIELFDFQIELNELVHFLNNRVFQVNLIYAYVLYYYNRGIPDEEWQVIDKKGKIQFFPHLNNEHWTNKIHFEHHIDSLFQRVFTTQDLIAHVLYKRFGLVNKGRGKISFNNAITNLKEQEKDEELSNKLRVIKVSEKFRIASKIRNDIVHNKPPYRVHTVSETRNGVTAKGTHYMTSKQVIKNIQGLLECVKEILETVRIHCEDLKM